MAIAEGGAPPQLTEMSLLPASARRQFKAPRGAAGAAGQTPSTAQAAAARTGPELSAARPMTMAEAAQIPTQFTWNLGTRSAQSHPAVSASSDLQPAATARVAEQPAGAQLPAAVSAAPALQVAAAMRTVEQPAGDEAAGTPIAAVSKQEPPVRPAPVVEQHSVKVTKQQDSELQAADAKVASATEEQENCAAAANVGKGSAAQPRGKSDTVCDEALQSASKKTRGEAPKAKRPRSEKSTGKERPASPSCNLAPVPRSASDKGPLSPSGKVMVLFTGFARGDLHRLRKSVVQLGGMPVHEMPPPPAHASEAEADMEVSADPTSVRLVIRCDGSSAGACTKAPQRSSGSRTAASKAIASRLADRVASTRTLKYFDAILAGAWVLSPAWVHASNAAGHWLPEADFELLGDTVGECGAARGRAHGPQLFAGLRMHFPEVGGSNKGADAGAGPGSLLVGKSCISLDDESGPRPADLERLARRGAAEVLPDMTLVPFAREDPPHLSATARTASKQTTLGKSRKNLPQGVAASAWWRRPIVIVPAAVPPPGGAAAYGAPGNAEASGCAAWLALPSSWMLDCISHGELIAAPAEWEKVQPVAPEKNKAGSRSGSFNFASVINVP